MGSSASGVTSSRPAPAKFLVAGTWLALSGVLALLLLPHLAPPGEMPGSRRQFGDFRDIMWLPFQDFWAGHLPWDTIPYQHRHPEAQIFPLYVPTYWPLSWILTHLPYWFAVALWIAVLSAAMVGLVAGALKYLAPSWWRSMPWLLPLLVAFVAYTPPGKVAIFNGNWQVICSAAAAAILWTDRRWTLVMALALAVVKPQVGVPLTVLYLTRRRWREVLIAALGTLIVVSPVVIIAAHRAGDVRGLAHLFLQNSRQSSLDPTIRLWRIDIAGTYANLFPHAPAWGGVFIAALVAAVLLVCFARSSAAHDTLGTALTAGLFLVLLLPNLTYACLALVPGLVGAAHRALRRSDSASRLERAAYALVTVAILVPFLNFNRVFPALGLGRIAAAAANCSALCVAFVIVAALVWRGRGSTTDPEDNHV